MAAARVSPGLFAVPVNMCPCYHKHESPSAARRLTRVFLRDESGRSPVFGYARKFLEDPNRRDYLLFYGYFHGDDGTGLVAAVGPVLFLAVLAIIFVLRLPGLPERGARSVTLVCRHDLSPLPVKKCLLLPFSPAWGIREPLRGTRFAATNWDILYESCHHSAPSSHPAREMGMKKTGILFVALVLAVTAAID